MASLRLKPVAVIQLLFLLINADLYNFFQITQFNCGNGEMVPQLFRCDGDDDCRDGADERNCSRYSISRNYFFSLLKTGKPDTSTTKSSERFNCGNGKSVLQRYLCDGDDDCRNGADERNCYPGVFHCGDRSFISKRLVCDGEDDCIDGADERNCSVGRFNCGNKIFVPNRYLCDGYNDCFNDADERNCSTETAVRTPPGGMKVPMYLKEDARIQSPYFPQDYPNNLNILWNVSTVPGHRIKVAFIVIELENSRHCSADRLSLYDGQELSSSSLGVYCSYGRDELPETALSSSNAMVVQFTSDSGSNRKGFDLALSTVCGGALIAQPSENELLSHLKFGDEDYGKNISCDWIIKSRPERNVQVIFSKFDVGNQFPSSDTGNCVLYNEHEESGWKDFVEIYNGPDDSSRRIGKYAGYQIPPTITSRREELLIRFRSGDTGSFRGFRAVYKEV